MLSTPANITHSFVNLWPVSRLQFSKDDFACLYVSNQNKLVADSSLKDPVALSRNLAVASSFKDPVSPSRNLLHAFLSEDSDAFLWSKNSTSSSSYSALS